MSSAISGLVRNTTSLGIFASARRALSSVHSSGKYNSMSSGRCWLRVATVSETATWQLVILPAVPVYWRLTPTLRVPCLRNPVSSRIQASISSLSSSSVNA
jgi:hypothetical protein